MRHAREHPDEPISHDWLAGGVRVETKFHQGQAVAEKPAKEKCRPAHESKPSAAVSATVRETPRQMTAPLS